MLPTITVSVMCVNHKTNEGIISEPVLLFYVLFEERGIAQTARGGFGIRSRSNFATEHSYEDIRGGNECTEECC